MTTGQLADGLVAALSPHELARLGTMPDPVLAERWRTKRRVVARMRDLRGVPAYRPPGRTGSRLRNREKTIALLKANSDNAVAAMTRHSTNALSRLREEEHIPKHRQGREPDGELRTCELPGCTLTFWRSRSQLQRARHYYCKSGHRNTAMRKNDRRVPFVPGWEEQRERALDRDSHRCGCRALAVDVHHIKPRANGGTDELGNLLSMCRRCHTRAERATERALLKAQNGVSINPELRLLIVKVCDSSIAVCALRNEQGRWRPRALPHETGLDSKGNG